MIAALEASHNGDRVWTHSERHIPGVFDAATGEVTFSDFDDPEIDDLLDDIAERGLKAGGDVMIVPAERMPTETGVAAIYRY